MSFRGGRYAYWRSPRRFWWGGGWRTLAVLGAIGTVYYGTTLYQPYAYAAVPAPYCGGESEDGCRLEWRDVPTDEGGTVPQCVQFCPQGVTPAPISVSAAQAVPAPTGNEEGCEIKGFSEPDLGGESFTTGDNYPTMDEWTNQVASVEVVSGTWELFTEAEYGGETIRLTPGPYKQLGDAWAYQIASFMCVQPGNEQ